MSRSTSPFPRGRGELAAILDSVQRSGDFYATGTRRMSTPHLVWAVVLFVSGCAAAPDGSDRQPRAPVVVAVGEADEWERLVAQLADPAVGRREEAQAALLAAGRPAGPTLIGHRDHADLDVRRRVRTILDTLGILSAADHEKLDALIARVLDGPKEGRQAAARQALAMGPAGRDALSAALLAPIGTVRWTFDSPAWVTRGTVTRRAQILTNTGRRAVLLPLFALTGLTGPEFGSGGLVPSRPVKDAPSRSPRPSQSLTGANPPGSRWPPGGQMEVPWWMGGMGAPGNITEAWIDFWERLGPGESITLDLADLEAATGPIRWHGELWVLPYAAPLDREDPESVVVGANDPDLRHRWGTCVLLPAPDDRSTIPGASMSIDLDRADPAGAAIRGTVVVRNGGAVPLRIDADWPRYTWIALAKPDGTWVACRPANEGGAAVPDPDQRVALDIAPGGEVRYALALTAPDDVGRYRLVGGYDAVAHGANAPGAVGVDADGYAVGRILAPWSDVEITQPGPFGRLLTDILAVGTSGPAGKRAVVARILALGKPSTPTLIAALDRLDHGDAAAIPIGAFVVARLVELHAELAEWQPSLRYDAAMPGERGKASRRWTVAAWSAFQREGRLRPDPPKNARR